MTDLLTEAYLEMITEAPVDDIGEIRSKHFTQDLPARSKFKKGDPVVISQSAIDSNPALGKAGHKAGDKGTIVGMAQYTGAGATSSYSKQHGANRYYVKMEGGKIFPINSQYVHPAKDATAPYVQSSGAVKSVPQKDGTTRHSTLTQNLGTTGGAPKPEVQVPNAMETVIEAAELTDLIHVFREYVKQLPPDQATTMAEFFMDRLSPKHEVEPSRNGPRDVSPFGPSYRNVPGYRPGNKWQDEQYRAVQHRGW